MVSDTGRASARRDLPGLGNRKLPVPPKRPLATFMAEKGFSQKDLAEKAGIHRISLHHIVRGKRTPTVDVVRRICAVLNIRPYQVIEFQKIGQQHHEPIRKPPGYGNLIGLRELRTRRAIDYIEAANGIGISWEKLLAMERNDYLPKFTTIRKVAGFYHVDPLQVVELRRAIDREIGPYTTPDRTSRGRPCVPLRALRCMKVRTMGEIAQAAKMKLQRLSVIERRKAAPKRAEMSRVAAALETDPRTVYEFAEVIDRIESGLGERLDV